jgi:hypothetical protein
MRRPCLFVYIAFLLVLTACTSHPAHKEATSILDVLDRSNEAPAASPRTSGPCPANTVAVCVAEMRMVNPKRCSCVDRADAMGMFGGKRF